MKYGFVLVAAYIATIPAANWMIGHVGTCIPLGPCVIPVFPKIMAPSGVLMIGLALLLRDLVQRMYGLLWGMGCILAGTLVSFLVAPAALSVASGTAFLLSELTDFSVYTPLARRRFMLALAASCAAGAVVDSAIFLWLAFGSLEFITGQIIGKLYAVAAFALLRPWVMRFA
jgi:uncharacterized PurR-regulated membrane protein YhhQ (DUF165 family)